MTSSFSLDKRNFLHKQLDEIIRLWARASGQGSFSFTVNDGTPELQFGIQLGFEDAPLQEAHHHPQQLPHNQQSPVKWRGQARRERDRLRAARHQAAKTAAAVSAAKVSTFPGEGKPVGTAEKSTLPLPLAKGAVFPSIIPTAAVCSTPSPNPVVMSSVVSLAPSQTNTTSTASLTQPLTTALSVPVHCRDAVVSESEEERDDEQFQSCGRCLETFDSSSVYGYCPMCGKCYHTPQCALGHQCLSFVK